MATVIKLGGCNGSGKSSLARAIMSHILTKPKEVTLLSGKRTVVHTAAYSDADFVVLGKYETACGGMDTISDKEDRLELLRRTITGKGHKDRIVFYEGLITGKTYGAMGELSESTGNWIYAFMDTPFDVCVERVLARRAARGNTEPFDPERTMRPTFRSCEALSRKLIDGTLPGHDVYHVNHKHQPPTAAKNLVNYALKFHRDAR